MSVPFGLAKGYAMNVPKPERIVSDLDSVAYEKGATRNGCALVSPVGIARPTSGKTSPGSSVFSALD
jgi:hypothetical protein